MAQQRQSRHGGQQGQVIPTQVELQKIMVHGNADTIVAVADRIGKKIKDQGLTTHQIRNIFGAARQIQMRWDEKNEPEAARAYRDAVLLRPKMAYFAQKKQGGKVPRGMETLQKTLDPALNMLKEGDEPKKERYDRFMELFEAIVAYHVKYGGERNK